MSIKLQKSFQDLIYSNIDYQPTQTSSNWTQVPNKNYKIIKSNKTYTIDKNLLGVVKNIVNIYKNTTTTTTTTTSKIATLFIINYSKIPPIIHYTMMPIQTYIRLNIYYFLLEQENIFEQLNITNVNDTSKVTFEIIEYILFTSKQDILEQKTIYYNLYKNIKPPPVTQITDKLLETRILLYYDLIKNQVTSFKQFTGYIYILTNIFNNKQFVFGYNRKLLNKDVFTLVEINSGKFNNAVLKYGRRAFNVILIEEFNCKTTIELLLKLDYYKMKLSSITGGYNDNYSLNESVNLFADKLTAKIKISVLKILFLRTQLLLLEQDLSFENIENFSKIYGYVYLITNKVTKARYVGYNYNNKTLKQVITDLYQEAITSIKSSKLQVALSTEIYSNFSFQIIKSKSFNDTTTDLASITESLIEKYNSINAGYNVLTSTSTSNKNKKKAVIF